MHQPISICHPQIQFCKSLPHLKILLPMGCCLGTTAVNHRQPAESKPKTAASQSPPPAYEEETVKEVLSETPIVPKNPPPGIVDHIEIIQQEERKCESGGAVDLTKTPTVESQENASEMSEMYSYSESFSAATTATTVADTKKDEIEMDDDDEVTQKVKSRSPPAKRVPRKRPVLSSGELAVRKEGGTGTRPLARRQMAPSPEKKRQSPSRTTMNSQRYRNVGPSGDARREGTARRSRSPAMRGETGQLGKVRERSPAMKSSDDVIPVKVVESEGKSPVEMADDGGVSPEPELQPPESLENPLVSLECFIFL